MKCINCGFEWNENSGKQVISNCPLCGCKSKQIEICKRDPNTILCLRDAINEIIRLKGEDILANKELVLSMLSDVAPKLKTEKLQLQLIVNSGVWDKLLKAKDQSEKEQKKAITQSLSILISLGIQDNVGNDLIDNIINSFSYSEKTFSKNNVEAETKTIKKKPQKPNSHSGIKGPKSVIEDKDFLVKFHNLFNYEGQLYIGLSIENHFNNSIEVIIEELIINGCMIRVFDDSITINENSSHPSREKNCYIHYEDLKEYGINTIKTISFNCSIRDYVLKKLLSFKSFKANMNMPITVGEKQKFKIQKILLEKPSVIRISYCGIKEFDEEGYLNFYVENVSDNRYDFYITDLKINDHSIRMVNNSQIITAQSNFISFSYGNYCFDFEDLKSLAISYIDEVSFKLQLRKEKFRDVLYERVFVL